MVTDEEQLRRGDEVAAQQAQGRAAVEGFFLPNDEIWVLVEGCHLALSNLPEPIHSELRRQAMPSL